MEIVDNFSNFVKFREQFPEFIFESFDYKLTDDRISFQFHFHIGNEWHFRPASEILFQSVPSLKAVSKDELDNLIFHIGMIELISYWKPTCSPNIIVRPYRLSETQIQWWKKLWYNGLGEFFYINSIMITAKEFVRVTSGEKELKSFDFQPQNRKTTLVPVGGGKDSPVTLELIKNAGRKVIPVIINPRGATVNTVKKSGLGQNSFVSVQRTIDSQLFEMNRQGYLNGHTPFSAMLAFYTLLVARLIDVSDIALSNESSANESTVSGTNINHQYSKSFEFERDFRNYYTDTISTGFNYFSFLRPLSELQIASLFSKMTAYHEVFRSCNVGSKEDIWCGNCPKCLFANIILSPFLTPEKLIKIFGSNLFEKIGMENGFNEMTGKVPVKPFECVGTISEVNEAIGLTIKKFYSNENTRPYLLKLYGNQHELCVVESMNSWNEQHFLLSEYEKILRDVSGIK